MRLHSAIDRHIICDRLSGSCCTLEISIADSAIVGVLYYMTLRNDLVSNVCVLC